MNKLPKADTFDEVKEGKKRGWNVVYGCCHCPVRRDEKTHPDNKDYWGTCGLINDPWPMPPVKCNRNRCPLKLRLADGQKIGAPIYPEPDKPTLLWRFRQWLKS